MHQYRYYDVCISVTIINLDGCATSRNKNPSSTCWFVDGWKEMMTVEMVYQVLSIYFGIINIINFKIIHNIHIYLICWYWCNNVDNRLQNASIQELGCLYNIPIVNLDGCDTLRKKDPMSGNCKEIWQFFLPGVCVISVKVTFIFL